MNKLIIIGASGHGKVVADIAIKMNKWQSIAFLDDDESIKTSMGLEVIGKTADAFTYKAEADFFVAIGSNATSWSVIRLMIRFFCIFIRLLYPTDFLKFLLGISVKL